MNDKPVQPRLSFDWAIYMDATLAGLALLIPIPLLDVFVEWLFKRRIPKAVARRNGRVFSPYIVHYLNSQPFSCIGFLFWPISLSLLLLKRIFRTILYFLTVKEASDKLSLYWHRAFLIDYMVRRGDLNDEKTAKVAALAMHEVLGKLTTSPLNNLAKQVIGFMPHSLRALWRWRRRQQQDDDLQTAKREMASAWVRFSSYLEEVANHYVQTLARLQATHLANTIVIKTPADTLASRFLDIKSKPSTPLPDDSQME